ncbi:hypothetical protein SANBI_000575 [Sanguibacter sp. 4.1]|uniref:Uncharacterized protein n=1 Tax=Sanguibacter biliveldensis TaxID=3030830 RepID=A0AAF0Z9B2_9MICO|nr:hypothetical protein [Sanguibacter sp. 4.1]WPF82941.1 hypothetical protein SANBI_000575 [Sanguibacter sp. 4.1]
MSILTEIFTASPEHAMSRARAHDEGRPPTPVGDLFETTGVTDLELEVLGEIVARAVGMGGIDTELHPVHLELDELSQVPDAVVAACAELPALDADPTVSVSIDAVIASFCALEDIDLAEPEASDLVRRVIDLAVLAHRRGDGLYLWTSL